MEQKIIEKLCDTYGVGVPIHIQEIFEGALNRNYILLTSKGKYFIKSVRDKKKEQIQYVSDVESLMKEKGIQAIVMLKTIDNKITLELNSNVYTLYDYIESDRSHKYSLDEYKAMGVLLASIHRIGSGSIPDIFQERKIRILSRELSMERLEQWKKEILSKIDPSKDDNLFLPYIDLKLELIPHLSNQVILPNTTLLSTVTIMREIYL